MAIKIITAAMIIIEVLQLCSGSAIPMWEFLSRSEQLSHLYSTFARQVSAYCKINGASRNQPIAQCKHELLTYGLGRLQAMSDNYLDRMDPFQRNSNELTWTAIMRGDQQSDITPIPPLSISAVILSPSEESAWQQNPIFDDKETTLESSHVEPSLSNTFEKSQNIFDHHLPKVTANDHLHDEPFASNILSGPLVIRVRPDGSPVEEDKHKPLPRDDDRDTFKMYHEEIPKI